MADATFGSDLQLVTVKGLTKHFQRTKGLGRRVTATVRAVQDLNFSIARGETLGLVGESGSGKTTTGRCLVRAIKPSSGEVWFRSDDEPAVDLLSLERRDLKRIRRSMSMVFQDPFSSLNPRMTVLEVLGEPLWINRIAQRRKELETRVADLLKLVHLDPEHMRRYPHAFSGGQRQRIAIARALALDPTFVVADEVVSALDVSVQAQILNLLQELQETRGLTYLFVSHNLAVVRYISHRVAVMYVGKIVEIARTEDLFSQPHHPYTEALLSSVPRGELGRRNKPALITGDIADPANPPKGCAFHPRCPYAKERCKQEEPLLEPARGGGLVACHFSSELSLSAARPHVDQSSVPGALP